VSDEQRVAIEAARSSVALCAPSDGSLSAAREGRMCIGRLKCGAVLRLTHVLGIRVRCG